MIPIRTCWYLCALFLVTLVLSSLIDVAPEGEKSSVTLIGTLLIFALTSGFVALFLKRHLRKKPDSFVFTSKVVSRICVSIAAILTLIFLLVVAG